MALEEGIVDRMIDPMDDVVSEARVASSLQVRLCREVAEVRRAGYSHEVVALQDAVHSLHLMSRVRGLRGLAWHAQMIEELQLGDPATLTRLYDLLDGLEFTLETTLAALNADPAGPKSSDSIH